MQSLMATDNQMNMRVVIPIGIIGLFGLITFALAAATLGTLSKQFDALNIKVDSINERMADLTTQSATKIRTTPITTHTTTTAPVALNTTTINAHNPSTSKSSSAAETTNGTM